MTLRRRSGSLAGALLLLHCASTDVHFGDGSPSAAPGASDAGSDGGGQPAPPATCENGSRDGTETDIDCGGLCHTCSEGRACGDANDCGSSVCGAGHCAAPSATDHVKNGDESDVDCGGTSTHAPACALGQKCTKHADCTETGACSYGGTCIAEPSCAGHFGGDTCGPGETGDPAALHESCCKRLPLTRSDGKTVQLDKYLITAGRMRAFFERTGGDVRAAMASEPKWDHALDEYLPDNAEDAMHFVGPYAFPWDFTDAQGRTAAGCSQGYTYWQNDDAPNAATLEAQGSTRKYPKDAEDEKTLNCASPALLRALCLFDGGDLASDQDILQAWSPDGRLWPWGNTPDANHWRYGIYPQANQCNDPEYVRSPAETTECNAIPDALRGTVEPGRDYLVHRFTYMGPGDYVDPDLSWHLAPPGRRPLGNGQAGHSDLVGGIIEWTLSGSTLSFTNTGSQENHNPIHASVTGDANGVLWTRRYWALGARCAQD